MPTYQRPEEVRVLLSALNGIPDPPGEVVLVDGSRDDQTEAAARMWSSRHPARFDLAYVRSRPGLTRQRNVGIDASRGEYIFYLDDDCIPEPGYFREIRKVFEGDHGGRVGAVCGSIVNEMARPLPWRWKLRFLLGIVPKTLESGQYDPIATSVPRSMVRPFTGVKTVDVVPGGATAYRRGALNRDRFSLFFEGYAQGEDLEMSLRVGRTWELLWCGDAHVNHYHAAGGRPDALRKGYMEVRNRYFVWKRHSPEATLLVRLRFWSDVLYVFACDVAYAIARPPRAEHLRHALGVARGAVGCLTSPPRYEEPPARRSYVVAWAEEPSASRSA